MKKSLLITLMTAAMAMSANAQPQVTPTKGGGTDNMGLGLTQAQLVAGGVGLAIAGGVIASSDGGSTVTPPPPVPSCEGDDPLVDGVCVGTTNTVTVTTSGTVTSTITVPVTFTYAPQ